MKYQPMLLSTSPPDDVRFEGRVVMTDQVAIYLTCHRTLGIRIRGELRANDLDRVDAFFSKQDALLNLIVDFLDLQLVPTPVYAACLQGAKRSAKRYLQLIDKVAIILSHDIQAKALAVGVVEELCVPRVVTYVHTTKEALVALNHPSAKVYADAISGLFQTPANTSLTKREREVASLLGKGLSDAGIASSLGIKETTVGTHLLSIFRKLNVHSRIEATHQIRADMSRD